MRYVPDFRYRKNERGDVARRYDMRGTAVAATARGHGHGLLPRPRLTLVTESNTESVHSPFRSWTLVWAAQYGGLPEETNGCSTRTSWSTGSTGEIWVSAICGRMENRDSSMGRPG